MKFRFFLLTFGLMTFTNCSQDDNPKFKGAFSMFGNSTMFVSCDGTVMNIKPEGKVYEKLKNRYIAFEMEEHPVLVTLKAKVIESMKLKDGKEIKDIEITSLLDMEIGKNCAGKNVNY